MNFMHIFNLSLHLSGKAESGSAGEQPARNNLTDWNGQGAIIAPIYLDYSKNICLKKLKSIIIILSIFVKKFNTLIYDHKWCTFI